MRIPPLSVIVTWPAPNYVNPVTHGHALLIVNIIFAAMVLLAFVLRVYCRTQVKRWFGWDDIMISLAFLFTMGLTVAVILADKRYGWNRHEWDIPIDIITSANIVAFVAKLLFTLAATFTRLSLCCFYYRLVKNAGIDWFTWVVHGATFFTVAVGISFVFLTVFQCAPISYYWQYPPVTDGECLNEGTVTLLAGILNLVADLWCTVVPIPLVMRLSMPWRQRISVSVLFGLGFVVIIAGIVRTFYIWKSLVATYDEPWFAYPLWIAAAVEIDIGVICACAPALKTLLHFTMPRFMERVSGYLSHDSPTPRPHSAPPPATPIGIKRKGSFAKVLTSLGTFGDWTVNRDSVRLESMEYKGPYEGGVSHTVTEVYATPREPRRDHVAHVRSGRPSIDRRGYGRPIDSENQEQQ